MNSLAMPMDTLAGMKDLPPDRCPGRLDAIVPGVACGTVICNLSPCLSAMTLRQTGDYQRQGLQGVRDYGDTTRR